MSNTKTKFQCPRCGSVAEAEILKKYKFIIYICPKCNSNIAQYSNKISIISNRMVRVLSQNLKFKRCGNLYFEKFKKPKALPSPGITNDTITDLKIFLHTIKDVDTFIKSI